MVLTGKVQSKLEFKAICFQNKWSNFAHFRYFELKFVCMHLDIKRVFIRGHNENFKSSLRMTYGVKMDEMYWTVLLLCLFSHFLLARLLRQAEELSPFARHRKRLKFPHLIRQMHLDDSLNTFNRTNVKNEENKFNTQKLNEFAGIK